MTPGMSYSLTHPTLPSTYLYLLQSRASLFYDPLLSSAYVMAPRRDASGPKPRSRKKRGQLPNPMPNLFPRAIHEWLRRTSAHSLDNHLFPEQLSAFTQTAWDNADPYTQEHFVRLADCQPGMHVQSVEIEPTVSDVPSPPRRSSRAKGKKASTKPRAKTTALPPPPTVQVHPATPPPFDHLEHASPPAPYSTCSSASFPLQAVVHSGGPSSPRPGAAPLARPPDGVFPPSMSPLATVGFQRDEGATTSEPHPSFPFAPLEPILGPPPVGLEPAYYSVGVYAGTGQGLPVSMDGGGLPVANIDPSLLDAQRQMRDQMLEFYSSMHPSLGYARMPSAAEHWPWG